MLWLRKSSFLSLFFAFLDSFDPYKFSHLENQNESYIRVNPSGVVAYKSEECDVLQRMPEHLRRMDNFAVPTSGCCYSRFYANQSRAQRPAETNGSPSAKPHVSKFF
jgi:hypothetical protein